MELGTFGAVIGFAAQLVMQSSSFYESAVNTIKDSELKAILESLSEEGKRDHALMEQVRRENVTEMILEPITGLDKEDYALNLNESQDASDAEELTTALLLEERDQRFFSASSNRIPLPEVARIFRKVAQKKEKNLSKLRSLRLNPNKGVLRG